MFRSQVQILSPQRITPDSLAIGSFLFPKTCAPAFLSSGGPFSTACSSSSVSFSTLPIPSCRLPGGFLHIPASLYPQLFVSQPASGGICWCRSPWGGVDLEPFCRCCGGILLSLVGAGLQPLTRDASERHLGSGGGLACWPFGVLGMDPPPRPPKPPQ